MIRSLLVVCLAAAACFAQNIPSPPAINPQDDKVVATIDGKEFKISDLELLVRALPPKVASGFYKNKKAFLEQYALFLTIAHMAEEKGIDKQFPHAQALEYNRMNYLFTALVQMKQMDVHITIEDQQKYYEEHKGEFGEAKVKVLYVAFNNNPMDSGDPKAKKPLTDVEAEQKANALLKQLRAGADFVQLVKENSDDEASRDKDGDFPNIKPKDDSIPPVIRSSVFALKPGEYTEPLRQPNGFYIFKLIDMEVPPFKDVMNDIYRTLQDQRVNAWIESVKRGIKIEFKDQEYLKDQSPRQ